MKNLTLVLSLFIILGFCSCSKSNSTPAATTVSVAVTDGLTGTVAAVATVSLYESTGLVTSGMPKYSQTTDQSGQTKFTVAYLGRYYIIVQKGTQKNYYNGLIPVGIFKTQADIQNNPIQTPAGVIGGVRFQDTNGDGAIKEPTDDVAPPSVTVTANSGNTFTSTIY